MTGIAVNRNFDLNIEKVLEGWETFHGVREIIANALDEQVLTQTKDVEIYRDQDRSMAHSRFWSRIEVRRSYAE